MADNAANVLHFDERVRLARQRLVEGTEVLRTGGGTTLTAEQCDALLDYIEALESEVNRADA